MDLEITFVFHDLSDNGMSTDLQKRLRRFLVEILERCEFGNITQIDENHYANAYAIPATDMYREGDRDLVIAYNGPYPIPQHGNIGLLINTELNDLCETVEELNLSLSFYLSIS